MDENYWEAARHALAEELGEARVAYHLDKATIEFLNSELRAARVKLQHVALDGLTLDDRAKLLRSVGYTGTKAAEAVERMHAHIFPSMEYNGIALAELAITGEVDVMRGLLREYSNMRKLDEPKVDARWTPAQEAAWRSLLATVEPTVASVIVALTGIKPIVAVTGIKP